jgi:hypothetical protein
MKGFLPTRATPKLTGHGGLCLLLIGLLLYNPFAGLWGPTDGVSCDKLARNRATLGASELQHFSPVSNQSTPADLDVDLAFPACKAPVRTDEASTESLEVVSPQAEYLLEYSNRPPPTL